MKAYGVAMLISFNKVGFMNSAAPKPTFEIEATSARRPSTFSLGFIA